MHIGPIIRRIRHAKELTLQKVKALTRGEISPSYLSRIEREELNPSFDNMVLLANVLGFSLDDVISEMQGKGLTKLHNVSSRYVPVISWVQAGSWEESPYLVDPLECEEWIEAPKKCGENSFALKVVGDSMTNMSGPSFPDGSLIIIDPDKEAASKSLVIACMDDTNEATFKQLIIDQPYSFLKPLNPQYPVLRIDTNIRIVGTVIDISYKHII